ncbi:MAG: AAA family ATPase [Verrucomicrobiales bacterium]|nr:AAA family ATPase [Verrucomicrobiales bacterium]
MINEVRVKYFKRFEDERFELRDHIVLAGPNNAGKTTLIQAINTWHFAFKRWIKEKYRAGSEGATGNGREDTVRSRSGLPITRKELTAVPLRALELLWTGTSTALRSRDLEGDQKTGQKKVLTITLSAGAGTNAWELPMEFVHANSEMLYVKPAADQMEAVPKAARELNVVYVPPFSGIGPEETRLDQPYQELLIGQGKAGEVLRNLLWELSQHPDKSLWDELVESITAIFGYRLLPPEYEGRPYILCEYLPGIPPKRGFGGLPRLDVASAGSGFQQVLLLLSFFLARPSTLLLLDEPDAHLHVVLQKQVYDHLRRAAAERRCQLIVATHSEVILDATSPGKIVSFYGRRPHVLLDDVERDQVREALRRITAMDLLLAEESNGVLYLEDETDFNLLRAWARVLDHPARSWFERRPFYHAIQGRDAREARGHFFALRAIRSQLPGYLLLDGDHRGLPDREITAEGLEIGRWRRYESESYLLHPECLRRFVAGRVEPLFQEAARRVLEDQLPPAVLHDPLGEHDLLEALRASKTLLPRFFEAADCFVPKRDYYLVAEQMHPEEIPAEVREKLDRMGELLSMG